MPERVLIKYILIWTVVTFFKPRCMTIGSITRKAKNRRQKTVWNAFTSYWPSKRPSPAKTDSATHETSIQNTDCKALSLLEICLKKDVFVLFVFDVKLISEALSCAAKYGEPQQSTEDGSIIQNYVVCKAMMQLKTTIYIMVEPVLRSLAS